MTRAAQAVTEVTVPGFPASAWETLRLPMIHSAMVRNKLILDIWHTVWC